MEIVRIPAERVQTIKGEKDAVKQQIEKKAGVTLHINRDGEVVIEGDSANTFFARDVVKAIGRGFEPREAMKLLDENFSIFIIEMKEYFSSEKAIKRIKGRIIGEGGRMKKEIERATQSYLSIYGNTVSIISKLDSIEYAKEAVFKIIDGAPHSTVFNYLAQVRKNILSERLR